MIYKIMNINSLNDELIGKYFPMLSPGRQQKISSMRNLLDRQALLCCEIIARQCLSQLCNAPEFSFSLLCNPGSKTILSNFSAEISVVRQGDIVACAVSDDFVGISLKSIEGFSFEEAQKKLSDTEIRAVFSESAYSLADIVNMPQMNERKVLEKYALFLSLKEAHFYASGRGIRPEGVTADIELNGNEISCVDKNYNISEAYIDYDNSLAVSVVERKKL